MSYCVLTPHHNASVKTAQTQTRMMRAGLHRREQLTFLEDNHRQPSRDSNKYSLWERVWEIKYAGTWRSYLK